MPKRKTQPPPADERVQLITKAEVSFDNGKTWRPMIRLENLPWRVRKEGTWMHRIELGEPLV